MKPIDLEVARRTCWDAIVVGTGMGGGTAGHALAQAGRRVLFIEKGQSPLDPSNRPVDGFPECDPGWRNGSNAERKGLLRRAGRATEEIIDATRPRSSRFTPYIGTGLGGSTALYGAALERFFPGDFQATRYFSGAVDSSVVDWPISYPDLEEFYEAAEALYGVHGQPDPLRPGLQNQGLPNIEYTAIGKELFGKLLAKGLHPYRLPVGHAPRIRCAGCQGVLCLCGEKSGSGNVCVAPVVESGRACLLENCEAVHLETDANKVQAVTVRQGDQAGRLTADFFLLGCGALYSPKLLLASKSNHWPTGIGNHADQLGRNLMRHYMDLLILLADIGKTKGAIQEKELAFNDFYFHEGEKLGTVQSLGRFPDLQTALVEMKQEITADHPLTGRLLFPFVAAGSAFCIKALFPRCLGFAAIMEDLPYRHNRVVLADREPPLIAIEYRLSRHERQRIEKFRRLISGTFSGYVRWLHPQAANNQRLAHACGTCRMGEDADASVTDPHGKVHGVDNLFIVDASVFPTSSGINPALTIAALALRTVGHLVERQGRR